MVVGGRRELTALAAEFAGKLDYLKPSIVSRATVTYLPPNRSRSAEQKLRNLY